jgi:lipoyl(octanoyl) transferase
VWRWLGRVSFADTATLQDSLRADILAERGPETLLLLEHEPVITLGRSADLANVLLPEPLLASRGIRVYRASRGGDVTYHGPGQLVGYPVVKLRSGVRAHVEAMAAALADVLSGLGIAARYRPDAPGLWVDRDDGAVAKICAFGINVQRRVTTHGFALNLSPDLGAFALIVPCGLAGSPVTSVAALLGAAPTPEQLADAVARALGARFDVAFTFVRETARPNCDVHAQ